MKPIVVAAVLATALPLGLAGASYSSKKCGAQRPIELNKAG